MSPLFEKIKSTYGFDHFWTLVGRLVDEIVAECSYRLRDLFVFRVVQVAVKSLKNLSTYNYYLIVSDLDVYNLNMKLKYVVKFFMADSS